MPSVTIPEDIRFYEKGTKPINYKKGQVVPDASADLIARVARMSRVPKPGATLPGGRLSVGPGK